MRSSACTPSRVRHAAVVAADQTFHPVVVASVSHRQGERALRWRGLVPGAELAQALQLRRFCEGEGRADYVGAKVDRRHTILLD